MTAMAARLTVKPEATLLPAKVLGLLAVYEREGKGIWEEIEVTRFPSETFPHAAMWEVTGLHGVESLNYSRLTVRLWFDDEMAEGRLVGGERTSLLGLEWKVRTWTDVAVAAGVG